MGIRRTMNLVKIVFLSTHGSWEKKWPRLKLKRRTLISLSKQNIPHSPFKIFFHFLLPHVKFLSFSACSFLLSLTKNSMFCLGNVGSPTENQLLVKGVSDRHREQSSLLLVLIRCPAKGINKNITVLGIVLWQLIIIHLFGFLSS